MAAANVRSEITKSLNDAISDEKSVKEIIADVKEIVIKTGVSEHDVVVLVRSLLSIAHFASRSRTLHTDARRITYICGLPMLLFFWLHTLPWLA